MVASVIVIGMVAAVAVIALFAVFVAVAMAVKVALDVAGFVADVVDGLGWRMHDGIRADRRPVMGRI